MIDDDDRKYKRELHPIHGILLASMFPLFLGGLLCDLAYSSSYQIQWSDFASWLIAGGLVFGGITFIWAIINLIRTDHRKQLFLYTLLLFVTWVLGFFNSLTHARDAWAAMPMSLILSVVVVLLACISSLIGFIQFGVRGGK